MMSGDTASNASFGDTVLSEANTTGPEMGGWSPTAGQIATGIEVTSIMLEGYGQWKGFQQKADSYDEQAKLDRARAEEIMRRAAISIKKIENSAEDTTAIQKTSLVSRGISSSGTLSVALARDSMNKAHEEIMNVDKAARYEKNLAEAQADANDLAAKASHFASTMSIFSTALKVGSVFTGPWGAALGLVGSKAMDEYSDMANPYT